MMTVTRGVTLFVTIFAGACHAQMGMMPGMGGSASDTPALIREDVPFVLCDVCKFAVDHAVSFTENKREELNGKLGEEDVMEIVEELCNPSAKAGKWARKVDIQQDSDGGPVKVVRNERPSKCGRECQTAASACTDALDEHFAELSDALLTGKVSKLPNRVCTKWSKTACKKPSKKKAKKMKNYKRMFDEEFVPQSEQDEQMEDMMAEMQAMGLGGQMYNRDQLGDLTAGMGDMDLGLGDDGAEEPLDTETNVGGADLDSDIPEAAAQDVDDDIPGDEGGDEPPIMHHEEL